MNTTELELRFHDALAPVMAEYMKGTKHGDETPDQAVQWDHHVHELAVVAEQVRNQNL